MDEIEELKKQVEQLTAERDAARAEVTRMEVRALESSIAAAQMRLRLIALTEKKDA